MQSGEPEPGRVLYAGRSISPGGFSPCRAVVDAHVGNQRADGLLPQPADRRKELRVPDLGIGLCESRHHPHAIGDPLRVAQGLGHLRRRDRDHDRRVVRGLGRDGGGARRLRRLCAQSRRHAAGHPQSPAGRLQRAGRGIRGADGQADGHPAAALSAGFAARGAPRLGSGVGARRGLRIPERADDLHRPHRDDRLGDGLRHHGHRAGLRPGQVQEAGRRRVFQDHQPESSAGPGDARLQRGADPGDRDLLHRTPYAQGRALHQSPSVGVEGIRRGGLGPPGSGFGAGLRNPIRLQQVDPGRRLLPDDAGLHRRPAQRPGLQHAQGARVHAGTGRRRQRLLLRHHDGRGGAASAKRAPLGVRLRQPLRPDRPALYSGGRPHPDDGGGPAVHQRRDQQDDQHAGRRLRGRREGGLPALLAVHDQGRGALSRRLEVEPAAQRHVGVGRRGGAGQDRRAGRGGAHHRTRHGALYRPAPAPAGSADRLHAEGDHRRAQALSADRRVCGRHARRDLSGHAQGRRRLPQPDELFRDRHLARTPARRAARGICRGLRLHAVRAERAGEAERSHQDVDLDHRLYLPGVGRHLFEPA